MKIYQIADIIPTLAQPREFYIGVFENTPDPEIEWPHRHAYYSLVWFTHGNGINVIDFDEYEIHPNRIFTVNPKQVHNWNYSTDSQGYFLLIDEPFAKQLNIDFSFPFVDIAEEDISFIGEIFVRMLSQKNQRTAIPYLFSLLNGSESNKRSSTLINLKRSIVENLDKNFSVAEYAKITRESIETLNHICFAETGLTIKQLQLELKITEAKRLLLYFSFNISEIAYKLGFEDNSYFSRIFKKKTSLSPAEFRKKYLDTDQKS